MSLAWSPRPRQASFELRLPESTSAFAQAPEARTRPWFLPSLHEMAASGGLAKVWVLTAELQDYHSRRIPTWRKPLRQRDSLVQFTKDISQDGSVRNWEDVLALLALLPSLRLRPDEVFFGATLGRLGKERQWHFALATLESMTVCESLQPNLITCSATVAACAKALKWFRACAILAHMKKDRSIETNTIAFDSAITACGGRSGSWAQAVHVYDILRVQGLAPISMTYNSAISAFEYRQHWQRGLEFLQELFVHRPGKRIAANVVSFNAALACCRKANNKRQTHKRTCPPHRVDGPWTGTGWDGWGALGVERLREDVAVDGTGGGALRAERGVLGAERLREDVAGTGTGGELWVSSVCGRTWLWTGSLGTERSREDVVMNGDGWAAGCGAFARGRGRGWVESSVGSSGCLAFARGQGRGELDWEQMCTSTMVSQWQWGLHLWKGVRRHLEIDAPHLREDKSADDVTYGCAVSACDHGWQWQWGLKLLCEAVSSGLRLGIPTMNSAISASAKSKKWPTCLALLRDMPSERLAPTRVSFTTALGAFSGPGMTRSKSSLVLEFAHWVAAVQKLMCPELLMEMIEQKIQPNALGLDIATQAAEASAFHSLAPGLVAQTRLAGAAACEATEDTFEEEDRHGEHSGFAIVAADSLEWHGLLDERFKASLQRRLCKASARRAPPRPTCALLGGVGPMQCDSMQLQQELLASERALSSCRSEIHYERQSAQKHAMALQRGEFEVQRAREHSEWLEVEGSSVSATVIEDLEAACSLCSEARCSAEDARYMQQESVTLAQVVLESHAILADYGASLETARKTRELAEESEALRNSLHFENALATEFRQQLREEAKSVKAVLVEYARLRGRREDALRGSALALRGQAQASQASLSINPGLLDGACLGAAVDLETLRNSLHLLDGQPSTRDAMQASFYGSHGSSLHSDPDASPQSPSMTTADLMLACADVSPLARVSQISQESALLDQSQATLSNGHLSDEVDVDVPLSGEIFSQRGSGAGSFLMDAESLTGEACNLSPHAGTELVEDGGLIRRSVGEKDAMVPDDVESPDPPDDGHLSISTTFEAPDADATKEASPRSDAPEGELPATRRPSEQAVPGSRDAEVQTEPEAQPEKAAKAPSTPTVPARSLRSGQRFSDIGDVSLGRRATSPARSCRTAAGRHEKATSPVRSPMTASQDSTATSPAKERSPRGGDFAPGTDRQGNAQRRRAVSPKFEHRAQVEGKATPRKERKPFRPSSPTPRLITKHPPSTLHKSPLAAVLGPPPESRPSEGQGPGWESWLKRPREDKELGLDGGFTGSSTRHGKTHNVFVDELAMDGTAGAASGHEQASPGDLRQHLLNVEDELKSCQAELQAERALSQRESIAAASLEAQLVAERRRENRVESEAAAQQMAIQRAEAETRMQLESARQLRIEAFKAAQEAQHLKSESSEAALVLSECKAALEEHDADEERQSELVEENSEMEAALTSETAIVHELRSLCTSESKCYSVAMHECDALRRELHDLTRILPVPSPGQAAGGNLDVNMINMSKRRLEELSYFKPANLHEQRKRTKSFQHGKMTANSA
ncbi:Pentatricopeptide repeat-containing protein, chloroplastic [Symbiodinium microadriaticum]|uniref:Pentatricopeptide repeat-containing protein, chloroplastic n=1 Tax=Symbiodinium microadriaticum TaxID=2951 RepID=A0A1Q9DZD6_SYMMI|nr:Pentatricopeptide repeat-containing protein, chloroplastic [Symbiodinium microadriaticum]